MGAVRSATTAFATVCAAAVVAPGTASADSVIARESRPTAVKAFGGRLVWSSYETRSSRYRLITHFAGITSVVPVQGRKRPFDVDLGPDGTGQAMAVYSRCRKEPSFAYSHDGLPSYSTGRGCDIFQYRFGRSTERRIEAVSSASASEFLPSIWKARLAFGRVFGRRRGVRGFLPSLYLRRIEGRAKSSRLSGGTRGFYDVSDGRLVDGGPGPVSLDLRGGRVGVVWNSQQLQCRRSDLRGEFPYELSEVLTVTRQRRMRIEAGCSGDDAAYFLSPSFGGGQMFYALALSSSDPGGRFHYRKFSLGERQFFDAGAPSGLISLSLDAGVLYYSHGVARLPSENAIEIVRADSQRFTHQSLANGASAQKLGSPA